MKRTEGLFHLERRCLLLLKHLYLVYCWVWHVHGMKKKCSVLVLLAVFKPLYNLSSVLFPVMFLIWNRMGDERKDLGGEGLVSCNCSPWGVLSWSVMKSCIRRGGSIFLFSTTTTHLPTASTARKDKAYHNYTVETQCSGGSGAWRAEL